MILYHYTTGEGLIGIVKSQKFHCTRRDFLNDPSESSYYNDLIETIFKTNERCLKIYNTLYNQEFIDQFYYYEYIISFCEEGDSLSMWKHYAKGNGYSVGIDIDRLIEKCRGKRQVVKQKIIYDRDEQQNLITETILSFENRLRSAIELDEKWYEDHKDAPLEYFSDISEVGKLSWDFSGELMDLYFKFKHPAYKDEQEVRLIIILPISEVLFLEDLGLEKECDYKITKSGVISEFMTIDLDPLHDIKSVMCHPQSTELNKFGVQSLLSKGGDLFKNVSRSEIPFRDI